MTLIDLAEIAEEAEITGGFLIEGERFEMSDLFPMGGAEAFSIIKPRHSIRAYCSLIEQLKPTNIVEIGVAYGGSTAFFALATAPSKILSFEISPDRIALLDQLTEKHSLTDSLHLRYGVDQSDTAALVAGIEETFGEAPLDLVIDDASHQYAPTISTFNTLYPRLREGGKFVIEDWRCDHATAALILAASADAQSPYHEWAVKTLAGDYGSTPSGQRPLASIPAEILGAPPWRPDESPVRLSQLAQDLLRCKAEGLGCIDTLEITDEWIVVTKGSPTPPNFDLQGACTDGALGRQM